MTPEGGTVRHPTQVCLALANVAIFLLLRFYHDHPKRGRAGQIVALFFALQGTAYLLIHPLRCFHPMFAPSMTSQEQMAFQACLALVAWIAVFLLGKRLAEGQEERRI